MDTMNMNKNILRYGSQNRLDCSILMKGSQLVVARDYISKHIYCSS